VGLIKSRKQLGGDKAGGSFDERKLRLAYLMQPHPGAEVVVPTAKALAARSLARRLLVAGLLGGGMEAVTPAPRGSVSGAMLAIAMRLEMRLYSRVRRVR
jgi:hypothetical protein